VQGVWYDTIQFKNTKCLWLVNDIVTTMNRNKMLWGSIGFYPIYAAGILNSVKEIPFYVLNCENLNYADYVEKYTASKEYSVTYKTHREIISSYYREMRQLHYHLKKVSKSAIRTRIWAKCAKKNASINKFVTYITNEVFTSKHDYVWFVSYWFTST